MEEKNEGFVLSVNKVIALSSTVSPAADPWSLEEEDMKVKWGSAGKGRINVEA